MYRRRNSNYDYPYTPYRPMFTRHLNVVGSSWFPPTQASLTRWRSPYLLNPTWWTSHPPWLQQSYTSRHFGRWQQAKPGLFFTGYQKPFHLSHGVMDSADQNPTPKRRRSPDAERAGQKSRRLPSQSPSPQTPVLTKSPNCWFQNCPVPPGEISSSPQKLGEPTAIKRQWEDLSHLHQERSQSHDRKPARPFDFSVMSYNILSQELLQDNIYLYKHCHSSILEWNHRFYNILRELEQHDADILCLQEVQEDHYQKQLKPSLESLGYHCEYKRRTGRKPDGCVVSFKRDHFSLVSQHPVEYFRGSVPILDRDNVGLVLLLRPAAEPPDSGPVLCVANTHLLYNPRRGDIKLAQLAILLAEITQVSRLQNGSACPVILCGDFNSVPWSPLYCFIRESWLEYEGIPISKVSGQEESPRGQRQLTVPIWPRSVGVSQQCQYETWSGNAAVKTVAEGDSSLTDRSDKAIASAAVHNCRPRITHSLRLSSAYSHRLKEGEQPEVTTCHSRTALTVDYIFYSAPQRDVAQPECSAAPEQGLQLLARLALVDMKDVWTANGLPNERNSSDHLPLLARFRLHP